MLQQPAIIAALIAAVVTIFVGVVGNYILQVQRLKFDEKLARLRFEYDTQLAERRFQLDRALADWKRQSDFAEATLTDFYEAHMRLRGIRSPMSFETENVDRPSRAEETDRLRQARDSYYPIIKRLNDNRDFFNEFYSRRYRAVALFGDGAEKPFFEIWGALHAVSTAAGMLMRDHEYDRPDNEFLEKMRQRIWEGLGDPDEIGEQINAAVMAADELFRPVLSASAPA